MKKLYVRGVLHINLVHMDWLLVQKNMVLKNVINVKSFRAKRLWICEPFKEISEKVQRSMF